MDKGYVSAINKKEFQMTNIDWTSLVVKESVCLSNWQRQKIYIIFRAGKGLEKQEVSYRSDVI